MSSTIHTNSSGRPRRKLVSVPPVTVSFQTERLVGTQEPRAISQMQIALVLHGSASFAAGSFFHELEAGDVLTIRPGVQHEYRHCHALQLVVCRFDPTAFRRRLSSMLDARAISLLLHTSQAGARRLPTDRFRSIAALLNSPSSSGQMGNVGRLMLFLETVVESTDTEQTAVHPAVLRIVELFDDNLAYDWNLPDLSKRLNLDPSYLARLFKSSLGEPPLAYLAILRSEVAAALLAETKLSCAAVGDRVGWADPNYFSRRFRQHFGESPTTYRERAAHSKTPQSKAS